MLVPEFLFRLTRPKDQAQQQLAVVNRSVVGSDSNAQAIAETIYQNTTDEVLILSNWTVYTDSDDGTLTIDDLSLFKSAIKPGAAIQEIDFEVYSGSATRRGSAGFSGHGQVWIMPGELVGVKSFAEGAGGATEHRVLGYIHGVRIPRANITSG